MKHTNTLCGQNAAFWHVKAGGMGFQGLGNILPQMTEQLPQLNSDHKVCHSCHNKTSKLKCDASDKEEYVGFEVITGVVMKGYIFWDMTPCSPLKINQHLGNTG
jgi:hypothetical protein